MRPRAGPSTAVGVALAVLVAVAAVGMAWLVGSRAESDARVRDQRAVQEGRRALQAGLAGVVASLRGAGAIVGAGGSVSPDRFEAFAQGISRARRGDTVALVEEVPAARRSAFEATIRGPITESASGRRLRREPERSRYLPVRAVWPATAAARRIVGFDLLSAPSLRRAVASARAARDTWVSEPGQVAGGRRVMLALEPLYRPGGVHAAPAGYVAVAFDAAVVAAAFGRLPHDVHASVEVGGRRVFASASPPHGGVTSSVVVGGRRWRIVASGKPASDAFPIAILVSGLLLAGLILAFAVSRRWYERRLLEANRAERAARERSELLERHAARLVLARTEQDVAETTTSDLVHAGVDAVAIYQRAGGGVRLLDEAGDVSRPVDAWAEPAAREAISTGGTVEQQMRPADGRAPPGDPAEPSAPVATVLAVAIPSPAASTPTGVVVVAAATATGPMLEEIRLLVAALAEQCSVALERARLDALRSAARHRTATLQILGARLSEAIVPPEVADSAVATLARSLEPDLAIVGVEGQDGIVVRTLRLELGVGYRPLDSLPSVTTSIAAAAVAEGEPVEAHGASQIAALVGPDAAAELGRLGVLSLTLRPLRHQAGYLGVLFRRVRVLGGGERELLDEIGDRVSAAVERTSLFELERDARHRAEHLEASASFVSTVSEHLERATGAGERARCLVELLTDYVATFAAVHLADDSSEGLVAESGVPPGPDDAPRWAACVRAVIATGRTQVLDSPANEKASSRAFVLSLNARGRSIGALTVWTRGGGGAATFPPALADEVASRAAILLDNALLYEHERDASHALQLGLLGGTPPSFDGVDVSATYRAGTEALEVGGDWYDAFSLPSGAIGLVVGDVVGHGLEAAIAMGQLRGAVSALARSCEPAELLEQLDDFVENVPSALAATLAYAELAPDGGLTYACAGHPPPLVVAPDGETRFLWDGRSAPLGSVLGGPRVEATGRLEEGEMLVLYTDGLVERRDERLDVGLGRLERAATLHAGRFDALGQEVLDALLAGRPQDDDACVLAARKASSSATFRHAFVACPSELHGLRDRLRTWLGVNGVDRETTWGAVLAVSEAAANAIEHGYGSDGVGVVTVAGRIHDGALSLTVRDAGGWRDEHAPGDRGRGLPMMESVLDELAVERSPDGTLVRMTQATHAETAT